METRELVYRDDHQAEYNFRYKDGRKITQAEGVIQIGSYRKGKVLDIIPIPASTQEQYIAAIKDINGTVWYSSVIHRWEDKFTSILCIEANDLDEYKDMVVSAMAHLKKH